MDIANAKVRSQLNILLRLLNCLFIFTKHRIDKPRQECVGLPLTRISLRPCLAGLLGLFLISSRASIVISGDKEFLVVAGTVPQLISFLNIFRAELRFAHGTVREPERGVCGRKLGVDLDGVFEEWNRCVSTLGGGNFPAHAVSL